MKDSSTDYRAMMELVSAMHALLPPPKVTPSDAMRRKQQKWWNRLVNLKLLLGVFMWRYLFLPVGIRVVESRYDYDNIYALVEAKQLHIFGIRIARWVTGVTYHRQPRATEAVPLKRHKQTIWRKQVARSFGRWRR